jgi:hypothetical protein
MDKFLEQLLKTKKSPKYKLIGAAMYFSIFGACLYGLYALASTGIAMMIIAVIFIAVSFALKIFRDRQYKEYEYIFTNGNLQIDVIFNKKKRKTLYDVDVKNFDNFGKGSEINVAKGVKLVNCYPWDDKSEQYVILLSQNGKQAVYITPNEELLKLMRIYNIRRPRA